MLCSSCCVSDLDLGSTFGQRLRDRGLADHLPHRALGRRFDGQLLVADVEQIRARIADHPEHGEIDVDDVLVAGQHQRLFGHLARSDLAGRLHFTRPIADLGSIDPRDARRQHPLDRARQMIVEPRLGRAVIGAKAQHDADLVGEHAIKTARQPDHDDGEDDDGDPGAGAEPARQQPPKPVLAPAQHFLEIGRPRHAPAGARPTAIVAAAAPRAAAARAAAPGTTALAQPEHRLSPNIGDNLSAA